MKRLATSLFFIFCAFILAISLRGLSGAPNASELNDARWTDDGPLELSPERGRFALMYSLVEDKTPFFSVPVARLALPDLGFHNGKYVSLFAPGLSYLVAPGYMLGKSIGMSQLGTFAVIAVFALCNAFLVFRISRQLGANTPASLIASLTFLFATPAFAYAVTLYQHHVSTFLLLACIFLLIRFKSAWSLLPVWLLIACSIPVDYPNLVVLAPVGLYALGRIVWTERIKDGVALKFRPIGMLTFAGAILPLAFFLWFNSISYNNPLQIAGTVASVKAIDAQGIPVSPATEASPSGQTRVEPKSKKTVVGFFRPRNMLHGLMTHITSIDRGMFVFTPVILFGIAGLAMLFRTFPAIAAVLTGTVVATLLMYAMWGDPWGGWAFGSRYLIPAYAMLSIGVALALTAWTRRVILITLFAILLAYSLAVNTLGALTSNRNPPSPEIEFLSKQSGRAEERSYDRNIHMLEANKSKSFVFNAYAKNHMDAYTYYRAVVGLLSGVSFIAIVTLMRSKRGTQT